MIAGETVQLMFASMDDFRVFTFINNTWTDTTQSRPKPVFRWKTRLYVVQTALRRVIQRCILMTTDPGDLVLDPTCGSGTTAYVAEGWGRRWITIDTSRVALALARARIMGARYDYYLLCRQPRRATQEGGDSTESALGGPNLRRYPPGVRVRAGAPHHAQVHRSTTPKLMSSGSGMRRNWRRSAPSCRRLAVSENA